MGKAYKIEYLPIGKVKLNEGNPRFIKDDAFKRLVKSLEDCPDLFNARPLLCSDRTGELIVLGGNMRLRAAKELKYKEVPVIVMQGLTEDQEREIAIKDNGAFGEWDYDALANVWSDLPLAEWGVDVPKVDDIEVIDANGNMAGMSYGDVRGDKVPVNILGIGGMIDRDLMLSVKAKLVDMGAAEDGDSTEQLTQMFNAWIV